MSDARLAAEIALIMRREEPKWRTNWPLVVALTLNFGILAVGAWAVAKVLS